MKNKNKIVIAMMLPFIWLASSQIASASYDCSTMDREVIKTVFEKQRSNEALTTDEQTLLDNAKSCIPTMSWSWYMMRERFERFWSWNEDVPEMTAEQKIKMDAVKNIMEKKRNWETLTSEEQTTLDTFEANKPQMWSLTKYENNKQKNIKGDKYWNLSNTYKTKIDTAMNKIINNIISYSTEDKLATLNTLKTKIDTARSNIENSSYSDSKKTTYNNILDYLLNRINNEIDNLWSSSNDADNLLNSIFQ